MDDILEMAEFRAPRFAPVLPEESQVNPGCYGAELAFWLCVSLAGQGVITSYPDYEDWGWLLNYATPDGDEFALHCGNVEGERDQWMVALRRYGRTLFGFNKPSFARARPLILAVRDLLRAEPGVSELVWKVNEEGLGSATG